MSSDYSNSPSFPFRKEKLGITLPGLFSYLFRKIFMLHYRQVELLYDTHKRKSRESQRCMVQFYKKKKIIVKLIRVAK